MNLLTVYRGSDSVNLKRLHTDVAAPQHEATPKRSFPEDGSSPEGL